MFGCGLRDGAGRPEPRGGVDRQPAIEEVIAREEHPGPGRERDGRRRKVGHHGEVIRPLERDHAHRSVDPVKGSVTESRLRPAKLERGAVEIKDGSGIPALALDRQV